MEKMKLVVLLLVVCVFSVAYASEDTIKKGLWYDPIEKQYKFAEYVGDEIIVKFKEGSTEIEIKNFCNQFNLQEKRLVFGNWYEVKTDIDPIEKINKIKASGTNIVVANGLEPNFIMRMHAADKIPNDPLLGWQWNYYDSIRDHDIDITEVWDMPAGKYPVTIGIPDGGWPADTSARMCHPDLPNDTARVLYLKAKNFSWLIPDTNQLWKDFGGHGTFIAGQLFGIADNGKGIAGMLWNVLWKALIDVVWTPGGSGTYKGVASAFVKQVNEGADIISFSGGGGVYSFILEEAIHYAWGRGCLFCRER
ncbi:MAG: hypothetical protein HYW78_02880 [Parcubacteria group bacterium]|nr:hypothetical protein [Parcubacteria group bacterium]